MRLSSLAGYAIAVALATAAALVPASGQAATTPATVAQRSAAKAAAVRPDDTGDFRFQGVRIWSNDSTSSTVVGLGYIGQGWTDNDNPAYNTTLHTCADGSTSNWWIYGHDIATGVAGWVPTCNVTTFA